MDHSVVASVNSASAETRKQNTRAALRGAMLALIAEKPFEQIQILDLTGRAKVGYATFFRHYSSTQDVLDEVVGDQIRELLEMTIPVLHRYDSAASMRALCQYVSDRQGLWRPLLTGGAAHTVRAEFVRQAREWAKRAGGAGKTSVPVDLGTVCSAGSTIDALAWWLREGESHTVDEIAGFIDRLVIRPFIDSA